MFRGLRILAVIPARAGSKRIKNKNLLPLAGKPLLNWTIEAGLASKYIDKVIVSTDSDEICEVGLKAGAHVPFIRPSELASDYSSSAETVLHAVEFLRSKNENYDMCILLQPTSPLRVGLHVDEAIESFDKLNASAVISVTSLTHPIEWVDELGDKGEMDKFFDDQAIYKRSQDFPPRFIVNGAIYVFDVPSFLKQKSYFFKTGCFAYVMNGLDSIDIDTYEDFKLAELLINNRV
jgi:CMP-N,N'-diacetyllegionaminic acid synthase